MYNKFLNLSVIPKLIKLCIKYEQFYTFKKDSHLQLYFKNNNIKIKKYFILQEIINKLLSSTKTKLMTETNNKNLIILNAELQLCFLRQFLFIPELNECLKKHIEPINNNTTNRLTQKKIYQKFKIKWPKDLIYNDTSSLFIIRPQYFILFPYLPKSIFSWKELVSIFSDICFTNRSLFKRVDEETFIIVKTEILFLFGFQYFNINQIEDILINMVIYIGKTKSLITYCKNFHLDQHFYQTVAFIDFLLNLNITKNSFLTLNRCINL
jgi:hypothetical protein